MAAADEHDNDIENILNRLEHLGLDDQFTARDQARQVRRQPQLDLLDEKYQDFINTHRREPWFNELRPAYDFSFIMNRFFILQDRMQFEGPMATLRRPLKRGKNKVLIIFFAPSNSTNVGDPNNPFDWDPFKHENGNYVISFQRLCTYVPNMDFDRCFLLDMFPHRIWEEDLEIEREDINYSRVWLKNMITLVNPHRLYVANRTWAKRLRIDRETAHEVNLLCHPGYSRFNPRRIVEEWTPVAELVE